MGGPVTDPPTTCMRREAQVFFDAFCFHPPVFVVVYQEQSCISWHCLLLLLGSFFYEYTADNSIRL